MQLLYQREQNARIDRAALEHFASDRLKETGIRTFCWLLFDGIVANLQEIDAKISAAAENWKLSRMPAVDRNILRIGAFELLFMKDTPPAVAFDEAIELARRFGTADSSAFINGVLDRLRREAEPAKKEDQPAP